jgi:hypothetical protein
MDIEARQYGYRSRAQTAYCSQQECDSVFPTYAASPFRYRVYAEMALSFLFMLAGLVLFVGSWFYAGHDFIFSLLIAVALMAISLFFVNHAATLGDSCVSSTTTYYDAA